MDAVTGIIECPTWCMDDYVRLINIFNLHEYRFIIRELDYSEHDSECTVDSINGICDITLRSDVVSLPLSDRRLIYITHALQVNQAEVDEIVVDYIIPSLPHGTPDLVTSLYRISGIRILNRTAIRLLPVLFPELTLEPWIPEGTSTFTTSNSTSNARGLRVNGDIQVGGVVMADDFRLKKSE